MKRFLCGIVFAAGYVWIIYCNPVLWQVDPTVLIGLGALTTIGGTLTSAIGR